MVEPKERTLNFWDLTDRNIDRFFPYVFCVETFGICLLTLTHSTSQPRQVLRHLGLVESIQKTAAVSKPKKELPPHPRLKEFEELSSKLSKECVELVREKNLRQQGQDLLRSVSDTLWRSIRENDSESPVDALKPLVGILLADRDTKILSSAELAKIVLDEMKLCESRCANSGTESTNVEFFNRVSLDSIASIIPLMSEVKTYVEWASYVAQTHTQTTRLPNTDTVRKTIPLVYDRFHL